jgi:hypothetical protein
MQISYKHLTHAKECLKQVYKSIANVPYNEEMKIVMSHYICRTEAGLPQDKSTEQKLDFLMNAMNRMLGQLTTMNGRLDTHDRRLTRVETVPPDGVQLEEITEIDDGDGPPHQGDHDSNNGGRQAPRHGRSDGGSKFYIRPDHYG